MVWSDRKLVITLTNLWKCNCCVVIVTLALCGVIYIDIIYMNNLIQQHTVDNFARFGLKYSTFDNLMIY